MGLGMARSMMRAGLDVTGFDVRPLSEFGDFASRMIAEPAAFAADREVILSVVRDIAQTEDLLFDRQGILAHAPCLKYLVISSTLSPRYLKTLYDRLPPHIRPVDAPMSGAQVAADRGTLSFMLGGAEADLDALEPVFRTMGPKIHRMGGPVAGMTSKVLNNFAAAAAMAGARQVIDWAEDLGIDRKRLFDLMHDSSGQTWYVSNFDDIEFSCDPYDPENTVGILKKDVQSCLDAVDPATHDGLPNAVVEAVGTFRKINR